MIVNIFLGSETVVNKNIYTCKNINCKRTYMSRGSFYNHVQYECGGRKQFMCWVCNKKFGQKGTLKMHLYTIHGQLPFV